MTILIISSLKDAHIEFVAKHLSMPFKIVDPLEILNSMEFSISLEAKNNTTIFGGEHAKDIASVWFRKPENYTNNNVPVHRQYKNYSKSALRQHWALIESQFSGSLWVSSPHSIRKASSKVVQLHHAQKMGFRVPDTLFTSSSDRARDFIKNHRNTVMKSLSCTPSFNNGKELYVLWTTRVGMEDLPKIKGLHLAPAVFQETVEPEVDIRVTVIGDKVFAATITGNAVDKPESNVRDWKISHCEGDMVIEPYELPAKIEHLCREYVKYFDLQFSAIDLILDKKGKYWFIENNPNGQWAFVEEETEQQMGKAMADLLESPLRSK